MATTAGISPIDPLTLQTDSTITFDTPKSLLISGIDKSSCTLDLPMPFVHFSAPSPIVHSCVIHREWALRQQEMSYYCLKDFLMIW